MAPDSFEPSNVLHLVRSEKNKLVYKMPWGFGHHFSSPNSAYWGRISVIMFLKDLSDRWQSAPLTFGIGDIGWESGKGVHSHEKTHDGTAVDVYVIHKEGLHRPPVKAGEKAIARWLEGKDSKLTLELAKIVVELTGGRYKLNGGRIPFNDPEANKFAPNVFITDIARKSLNPSQHNDHMHVQLLDDKPYSDAYIERLQKTAYDWA